jgi:hypothetical protein
MTDKVVFEDYFIFSWWVNFTNYIEEQRKNDKKTLIETNRTFLKDVNRELLKYQAEVQIDNARSVIQLVFNTREDFLEFQLVWS